jgi:hypothetical protein
VDRRRGIQLRRPGRLLGVFEATLSAKANADFDLFAAIGGSQVWYERVAQRASVKTALADQAAARKAR